jgi:hypothetical protein
MRRPKTMQSVSYQTNPHFEKEKNMQAEHPNHQTVQGAAG